MNNKIYFMIFALIISFSMPANAYSNEPAIHEVLIDVGLSENGDARISEIWDVTVTSGTEWYLSFNNMKDMEIMDLSVTDESGISYEFVGSWDINQDISQKANKCGIVDKGASSYEICWGVGSYGQHRFKVSYTLSGLVRRYSDYAGFNHTFLSKDLSSPVGNAVVTIQYPGHRLDESTAKIWAFGYGGYINFSDNVIIAGSDNQISQNESIIIMTQFDNDSFISAPSAGGSFETVKSNAFEGSDYNGGGSNSETINPIIIILLAAAILLCGFIIAYVVLKASLPDVFYRNEYGQSRSELKKTAPENRDIPIQGSIMKSFGVLAHFGEAPSHVSLINYYMLKWAREGAITETTEQKKKKSVTYINLKHRSYGKDIQEKELYGMLAAASDGGRLSDKSIEKWSYHSYNEINRWYEDCKERSNGALKMENLIMTADAKRAFVSGSIDVLNESGWQYAGRLYGLKNYLMGIRQGYNNDEISDGLWDDYLIYADIFNIYDRMEQWYEDNYMGVGYFGYYHMTSVFRDSYKSGESHRSDGDGGSSSYGGGGGATGGGGGGSR